MAQRGFQLDAKRGLSLLSRRPFSDMWKAISEKCELTFLDKVWQESSPLGERLKKFSKVNYADNTYTKENIDVFLSFIIKELRDHPSLKRLSQKNIISTSMIRNLDSSKIKLKDSQGNIFNFEPIDYFNTQLYKCIDSIHRPDYRYNLEFEEKTMYIRQHESKYDMLSPPCFLPTTDSMGAYKYSEEEAPTASKNSHPYDPAFGEAIIEIRSTPEIKLGEGIFLIEKKFQNWSSKIKNDLECLWQYLTSLKVTSNE